MDLNLDGLPDLLGLPASASKTTALLLPAWARNEGNRFATQTLDLKLSTPGVEGLAAADLIGDALPDILCVRAGEPPALRATPVTASTGWRCGSAATGGSNRN